MEITKSCGLEVEDTPGKSITGLSSAQCRCGDRPYKSWQYPDGTWGLICLKCLRKTMFHTLKRIKPKIGRNEPCPCGSGKKYKKCCLK